MSRYEKRASELVSTHGYTEKEGNMVRGDYSIHWTEIACMSNTSFKNKIKEICQLINTFEEGM